MCYKVTCSSCGKTTWGGCGSHVPSVYSRIPEGHHCFCREWPGVDPNNPPAAAEPSSCAILMEYKNKAESVAQELYSILEGIKTGQLEDKRDWIVAI